ncbi:extensin family protein [Cellulomonas sp. A375-1]|uniref:M15 family metallopeptidase n=1 Tax=Cellulomonas sp. A375-1 TaxID=1672219 RepID=UPI00065273EF|nr:M15 family metallopeptidase [Cellulomonas sp. A375-1]KMM44745.1 extensin family protein [Cellulomonas sp. A375-1]
MDERGPLRTLVVLALAGGLTGVAACTAGEPDDGADPASSARPPTTSLARTPTPSASPSPTPSPSPSPSQRPSAGPSRSPTPAAPTFTSSVTTIDDELAVRMHASWRRGCPVPLADLRYVQVSHVDFDGVVRQGELVVHEDLADGIVDVFARLFALGYPIRSMRLVDDFGADDTASMDADNTSAFNCRAITGGTAWSEHAYGRALDLNPVENPYVIGSHVAPRAGRAFVDRAPAPGVIRADDEVVRAFAAAGWRWGGYWDSPTDYQHFSTTGR